MAVSKLRAGDYCPDGAGACSYNTLPMHTILRV